jgi:hypothetical protein
VGPRASQGRIVETLSQAEEPFALLMPDSLSTPAAPSSALWWIVLDGGNVGAVCILRKVLPSRASA